MKMKSDRPLLVNGVPQTEFETSDQHGKELIAKGLAVEVDADPAKPIEPAALTASVESKPVTLSPPVAATAKAPATPKTK